MHGIATLRKPARRELRRLGPVDRIAAAEALVCRIAALEGAR